MGMNPRIAKAVQSQEKQNIAFAIISQSGQWPDDNYPITDIIWQNTNHLIFRCESPDVLDKVAKDFATLFDPTLVKTRQFRYRQVIRGYEQFSTESTTERDDGSSTTKGQRERPIFHGWFEKNETFYTPTEQANMVKSLVSRLIQGQFFSKIDGEIDSFRLPLVTVDPGPIVLTEESNKWLRKSDSSFSENGSESMAEQMMKEQPQFGTLSNTSSNPRKPSNETSGHWSNVAISALSDWLWPENEKRSSTGPKQSD